MTYGCLTLRGTGTRRVTTIPEICILAQSSRRAAECLLADPPRNTALQARFVYRRMALQIRVVCIGVSDVTIGIKHQALSPVTGVCDVIGAGNQHPSCVPLSYTRRCAGASEHTSGDAAS